MRLNPWKLRLKGNNNARGIVSNMWHALTMLICLMMGGTQSSLARRYPIEPQWGVIPHPILNGYPHPDLGWGTPTSGFGVGYPRPDLGWGTLPASEKILKILPSLIFLMWAVINRLIMKYQSSK